MNEGQIKTNIQKKRISLGCTQTEMAKRLDISLNAYRKLESGKTKIFSNSFKKFTEVTETSFSELVDGFSGTTFEKEVRQLKDGYDQKILELQKEHAEEVQRLQNQIKANAATLKDKEDINISDKKLIAQYERRIEELERQLSE
jgi:Helix-turn-helix.